MCDKNEILEEDFENKDCEVEEVNEIQQMFDELGLSEEVKRIERQDSELEVPMDIQSSKLYSNMVAQAYGVAKGFKVLSSAGLSYADAVLIINNMSVGRDNKETAKAQGMQMQKEMV